MALSQIDRAAVAAGEVLDQAHQRAEFLAVLLFAAASAPTAAIILVHGNPFQEPAAVTPAPIAAILEPASTSGGDHHP